MVAIFSKSNTYYGMESLTVDNYFIVFEAYNFFIVILAVAIVFFVTIDTFLYFTEILKSSENTSQRYLPQVMPKQTLYIPVK